LDIFGDAVLKKVALQVFQAIFLDLTQFFTPIEVRNAL
jgi:hypothetical protein